jgi:hypothetical protein
VQDSEYAEVIINQSPRPRLLVYGLEGRKDVVDEVMSLCPTSRRCERLSEVRQAEWDLLITDRAIWANHAQFGPMSIVDDHMCGIYCVRKHWKRSGN